MARESSYEDFSEGMHARTAGAGAARTPLEGMIELTRLCSLKCKHCYIGDARWVRDPAELTTAELKALLDTLHARGTLWLCFTGGEALARKDFMEIWRYAKGRGFILTLFTNATLISRRMAEFLKANPPFRVEVSIYGASEETYERVTLVKGSYRRFLAGVDNLRATGLSWSLKTVLIQDNAAELDAMRHMAEAWGVKFKFDGNINPSIGDGRTGGKAPCATRLSPETVASVEHRDPGRQAAVEALVEEQGAHARSGRGELLFSCGAGKNSFYINASGSLQMCILTGHRGVALRAGGQTIDERFAHGWSRFDEIRKIKRRADSPCRTCDIALLCESCPGFAQLEHGDEHAAVAWLCRSTHAKAARLGWKHECSPAHFHHEPDEDATHEDAKAPLQEA